MNKGTPVIKYVLGLVILAAVIVAIVFIIKGKNVEQDASIYKVTDLKGASASPSATTPSSLTTSARAVPPVSVGCTPTMGPNGIPVAPTPSIRVISPNGGETYQAGQQITVKWTSCNIPGSQMIRLNLLNVTGNTAAGWVDTPNDGSEVLFVHSPVFINANVPIFPGMPFGNHYKVRASMTNPTPSMQPADTSDSTFTINGPTQSGITIGSVGTPTIQVAQPGGSQTHSMVTYIIPFSVTAFGQTAYIPANAQAVTIASPTNKIQFCVDATTACAAAGNAIINYTGSNPVMPTANGNYQIPNGQTMNFQLIATYVPSSAISTRASLLNVNWANADLSGTSGWSTYAQGLNTNSFRTPYAAAQ
jgi:hypothetical protein